TTRPAIRRFFANAEHVLDRLPESHFRFAKDCNVPEMAAGRSCQRCAPPKSSGLRLHNFLLDACVARFSRSIGRGAARKITGGRGSESATHRTAANSAASND